MADDIEKSSLDSEVSKEWEIIPADEAYKLFKGQMERIGYLVEYYKQKELEGLVKARTRVIGCCS